MIPAVTAWREIAKKYADLEVYPYSDRSPFVDQVYLRYFYNKLIMTYAIHYLKMTKYLFESFSSQKENCK